MRNGRMVDGGRSLMERGMNVEGGFGKLLTCL